jgi:hypothetical protein
MFSSAKVAARMVGLGTMLIATGWVASTSPAAASVTSTVAVVAGENEYGNVASQIGGKYVSVYSVDSNPNTDPHTYEATPSVGQKIAKANLLIENGVGYDTFMGVPCLGVAELGSQGDRRAASAGSAQQHGEPAPVVRPEDDAGRRQGVGE